VAKLLGDTVAAVENHYASFVKELRDQIMENGEGLEKTDCTNLHSRQRRIEGFIDTERDSGG
jgi:hypothetical protein